MDVGEIIEGGASASSSNPFINTRRRASKRGTGRWKPKKEGSEFKEKKKVKQRAPFGELQKKKKKKKREKKGVFEKGEKTERNKG